MSAVIQQGSHVKVHYTGTLASGKVLDTSNGDAPLEVTMGEGKLIKGFEDNLIGLKQGDEKTFTLAAEEAYGPRNAELVYQIPRDKFPKNINPQVGQMLTLRSPENHMMQCLVTQVTPETVTLDLNHPLAGQALTFTIKVVEVF